MKKIVRFGLVLAMALIVVSAWAVPVSGAAKSVESDISVGGNLYPIPANPKPPEEPEPEEPAPEEPTPDDTTPDNPTPGSENPTPGNPPATPENPTPNNPTPTPTPDNPAPAPGNPTPAPYSPPATPDGSPGSTPAGSGGTSTLPSSPSSGVAASTTSTTNTTSTTTTTNAQQASDRGGVADGGGAEGETPAPATVADADVGAGTADGVIGAGTDEPPLSTENPEPVPLVQTGAEGFALVNLLAAGFGAALFICARVRAAAMRKRGGRTRFGEVKLPATRVLPGLIAAAAGVVLCVLTQDLTGEMAMIDAYTPLQMAILAVVIGAFCLVDVKRAGAGAAGKKPG
jgi:hypothetical protein